MAAINPPRHPAGGIGKLRFLRPKKIAPGATPPVVTGTADTLGDVISPILVPEDTIYLGVRTDYSALLLFNRSTPAVAPQIAPYPFSVSSRWLEPEGEYSRANHQTFFQVQRQAPLAPTAPFPYPVSSRLPEVEAEYARADHQVFFKIQRTYPYPSPAVNLWRPAARLPEVEPDYQRANHQLFFQIQVTYPKQTTLLTLFRVPQRQVDAEPEFPRTDQQTLFRFIQPPAPAQVGQPFNLLFQLSARLAEIEQDYQRSNHQLYFRFIEAAPLGGLLPYDFQTSPIFVSEDTIYQGFRSDPQPLQFFWKTPTTTPVTGPPPTLPVGTLLPGKPPPLAREDQLGQGMGPYKRPGQVFGEPDPLSPQLSSRAPDAVPTLPDWPSKWPDAVPTLHNEDELALTLLLALEELSRRH